jgi:hypothetical protein
MNWLPRRALSTAALVGTLAVTACVVSGVGPSAASAGATTAGRLSLAGCSTKHLPAGFQADSTHSGSLTPAKYSASGDMQASLIYDQFRHGLRNVFTSLSPSSKAGQDLVIECVAMQFTSEANANRFFQSYRYQRTLAKGVAQRVNLPKHLSGASVGYKEIDQSFVGYHITSTSVVEAADQRGDDFYSVSVAGPSPSVGTAFSLLQRIAVMG